MVCRVYNGLSVGCKPTGLEKKKSTESLPDVMIYGSSLPPEAPQTKCQACVLSSCPLLLLLGRYMYLTIDIYVPTVSHLTC
jgi:hypothetical protein